MYTAYIASALVFGVYVVSLVARARDGSTR
jgi:hypothetical protein